MEYIDKLINWISSEVKKANANGVILGLSGGIDSALVAYLAKQACGNNFLAVLMPINKFRENDLKDGLELVKQFNINYQIIELHDEFNSLLNKTNLKSNLSKGNLQSRLRMTTLYAVAQENNFLVLGTSNKAEYKLGYFTKWGDGGCDLNPIIHLYKSEIFDYSKKLGICDSIINKKPSGGLWEGQSDEDELGFTYNDFELYDKGLLKDLNIIKKIENQINKTEHKRNPIKIPPIKE